jgi:hypothetical protein
MYCPKCGVQNGDDVKFCRACGTNLSLVAQALTGQIADSGLSKLDEETVARGRKKFACGVQNIIIGLGFAFTSVALCLFGTVWVGIWFFIPAFSLLGKGVEAVVSSKSTRALIKSPGLTRPGYSTSELAPRAAGAMPPAVSFMSPPLSVTEATTRNLDYAEAAGEYKNRININN